MLSFHFVLSRNILLIYYYFIQGYAKLYFSLLNRHPPKTFFCIGFLIISFHFLFKNSFIFKVKSMITINRKNFRYILAVM